MKPINLGVIGGFGPDFSRTHARTNDPGTSKAAARRAELFSGGHQGLIFESLLKNGAQTAKELGVSAGLTSVQISRRLADLERANAIKATGTVRGGCREFMLFLHDCENSLQT